MSVTIVSHFLSIYGHGHGHQWKETSHSIASRLFRMYVPSPSTRRVVRRLLLQFPW